MSQVDAKRYAGLTAIGWCYVVLVIVAAALRMWGLSFAEHTPYGRPDEEIFAQHGVMMFASHSADMASAGWPDLFFWVHHWVARFFAAYWAWRDGTEPNMACAVALQPLTVLWPVRLLSAIAGTLTVVLAMRLAFVTSPFANSVRERHHAALATGVFYGVNVLAARDAHYAVSDTTLVMLMLASFVAIAETSRHPRLSMSALAGAMLGLALATKWTALTFGFVPVFCLGTMALRGTPRWHQHALVGTCATVAGFVIGCPGVLSNPELYWGGLYSHAIRFDPHAARAFSYLADVEPQGGFHDHLSLSFPYGFGWPLFIVSLLALVASLWQAARRRNVVVGALGLFAVIFFGGVLARTTLTFMRYSLPIHPVLAVAAGTWLAALCARSKHRSSVILGCATLALALIPLQLLIRTNALLARPDTREIARTRILEAGIGPIATEVGYAQLYTLESNFAERCSALVPASVREPAPSRRAPNQGGVVSVGRGSWHSTVATAINDQLFSTPSDLAHAPWVVQSHPYLPCDRNVSAAYRPTRLPACFREVFAIVPQGIACDAQYDAMDHHYTPLDGFSASTRAGPEIHVFRNDCTD